MSTEFSRDIRRFADATNIKLDKAFRSVCLEAYTIFTLKTPVDTGAMKASWRIGVGSPDLSFELPGPGPNTVSVGLASSKAQVAVAGARFGDTVFITNNVPYAQEIERGKSSQAPAGVLSTGVVELVSKIDRVIGGK